MYFTNDTSFYVLFLLYFTWLSITDGIPTSIMGLLFMLFFDGITAAYEDYRRHKSDSIINSRPIEILTKNISTNKLTFEQGKWKNLHVYFINYILDW